jgi:hypothetical protein
METSNQHVVSIASYRRTKSPSATSDDPTSPRPRPTAAATRRPRSTRATSSTASVKDDGIVERVILGDLEAAAELRARYIGQMRRAAGAILCDEREAARAADTALEEACEGWPPERGRVDRWLLHLARRAAVARRKTLWGLGDAQEPRRRLRRPSKARLNTSRHESSH